MHRRFLFPLAAGVVCLVAMSPVFAAEPSPAKAGKSPSKSAKGPAKATTTSAAPSNGGQPSGGDPSSGGGSADSGSPNSGSADPGATPTSGGKGGATPTTAAPAPGSGGSSGAPGSSSNCAPPQTDQGPAPQVGEAPQNHGAGDAGTVDVERLSPTELRVAKASPNDGWNQQVTAPSGPRVTVKFSHPGASPSVVRFAASMDQAGRMIHIRVQACG